MSPKIPNIGKSANGKRAVAGKGMASVAHQVAINTTTAVTYIASFERVSVAGKKQKNRNKTKPAQKPMAFGLEKNI